MIKKQVEQGTLLYFCKTNKLLVVHVVCDDMMQCIQSNVLITYFVTDCALIYYKHKKETYNRIKFSINNAENVANIK